MKVSRRIRLGLVSGLLALLALGLVRMRRTTLSRSALVTTTKTASVNALLEEGGRAEARLDLPAALDSYKKAAALDVTDQKPVLALVTLYANMDRADLARPLLDRLDKDPAHPLARWPLDVLRGFDIWTEPGYLRARAAVEASIKLHPTSPELAEDLVSLVVHRYTHTDTGHLTAAHLRELRTLLQRAEDLGSRNWSHQIHVAYLALFEERYEDALRSFQKALADPSMTAYWERTGCQMDAGMLALRQGNPLLARELLEAAAQGYERWPRFHTLRARPEREYIAMMRHAFLGDPVSLAVLETQQAEYRKLNQGGSAGPARLDEQRLRALYPDYYKALQRHDLPETYRLSQEILRLVQWESNCATERLMGPMLACSTLLETGAEAQRQGQVELAQRCFADALRRQPHNQTLRQQILALQSKDSKKAVSEPSQGGVEVRL